MTHTIFSLNNVSLTVETTAGSVTILQDISFDVVRGETIGLVGPSGSGKSSLLMLLAGLEKVTHGTLRALEHDLSTMNEGELAEFRREHVGIVFQSFHLIPTMTAIENVATPLELSGHPDPFRTAAEELNLVGLDQRHDHYPKHLSGGEQQRVALARASAPKPTIMLADEPTGNLDVTNGTRVIDLLFDLRERHGSTLILVTHSLELAARCDRIISLCDGRSHQGEERTS
ncbi:MAG: ATP-binding cassette domain-containing protein [Aestuariivita sp.]|nr:ATP-binding cassette domain-containing protein [Aestuariivita sp.]